MTTRMLLAIVCVLLLVSATAADPGDTLWTRTYGGTTGDLGRSVQQTSDGGYIIAGYTESFGAGLLDVWLLKTDSSGDTLWTRTYGGSSGDGGYSVQQTSDGGYIIAGYSISFGAGSGDVWLLKTDSSGDTLWTRACGGSDTDKGESVRQTSDGGYIIAGYTDSFGAGYYDVWLLKTDSAGDTLWTRTYGGSEYDYGYSVQQTSDGGYIIAGYTDSFGAGHYDVWLVKTDSSGDTLWTRAYGGSDNDTGWSVQRTSDGGYIIAGYTRSFGAGNSDVWLLKTDSSGDTLWTRTYGAGLNDQAYSVQQTSDSGYVIAGSTLSFGAGDWGVYLIKTVGDVVEVDDPGFESSLPAFTSLSQCYPNPFNASTVIEYQLPVSASVKLEVYNLLGEKVTVLADEMQKAGYKSVTWDASHVSSGIYFYKLTAGDFTETRRMVLVK